MNPATHPPYVQAYSTMTEYDWLISTSARQLMYYCAYESHTAPGEATGVHVRQPPLASNRQLRLFHCAAVRQLWHRLTHPHSQAAVAVAERMAEGDPTVTVKLARDAWYKAYKATQGLKGHVRRVARVAAEVAFPTEYFQNPPALLHKDLSDEVVTELFREIVPNPFRPCTLTRTQAEGAASEISPVVLARTISELRGGECPKCGGRGYSKPIQGLSYRTNCTRCEGFGVIDDGSGHLNKYSLLVLADCLEENGCTDEDLLQHLRGNRRCTECLTSGKAGFVHRHSNHGPGYYPCLQCNYPEDGLLTPGWVPLPGPHVLGCWAVDQVRGKIGCSSPPVALLPS